MGNDASVVPEYEIEETSYGQVGSWSLHAAAKKNSDFETATVLIGQLKNYGQLTKEHQRAIERLKTLRHPSILKYLHSCVNGDVVYLIVEYVTPLNQILPQQSELEVCCGLQNILIALDFIHTKAGIVHNNICKDAVFVTKSGDWKLGYFDLSCIIAEVSQGYLDQIRSFRYDKSIPPEDEKLKDGGAVASRDVFAYGQLVKETVDKCVESGMPDADVFRDLASKQMQNIIPTSRGKTLTLSRHKFFDQPLLRVQDFLAGLAIKSQAEKEEFFKTLPSLLYTVPETLVGSKLTNTLLSRLVVLNPAAQQHLLPHLLIPRTDSNEGLLSTANYRSFILPVISRIFPVRDAQVRLVLLQYFAHYVSLMDGDVLVQRILPELLLGIKDTDDTVVAATLRALADLVPILGSATVIGGTRLKLFAHGAPKCEPTKALELARKKSTDLKPAVGLPERHEPDGGEDGGQSPLEIDADEHWSDWEAEEEELDAFKPLDDVEFKASSPVKVTRKPVETDLSALEFQIKSTEDEIDYFADMTPTITSAVFATASAAVAGQLDFHVHQQVEKNDEDGWNWDD